MSESREHHCPRCGAYLPTVTVLVPVWDVKPDYSDLLERGKDANRGFAEYVEREEVSDCIRCTGGY